MSMPDYQPSTGVFVRGVAIADAPDLYRLSHALGYTPEKEGFHAGLDAITSDPNHALFVAVDTRDHVIGFVHVFGRISVEDTPAAQVQALVVNPDAQRAGAGRVLAGAAEEWARARGFTRISLYCASDRGPAHEFYEAAGYALTVTVSRFIKYLT